MLLVVIKNSPKNQIELYKHIHVVMSHFTLMDISINVSIQTIKDNLEILSSLPDSFFTSLRILESNIARYSSKRFFKVDVQIHDPEKRLIDVSKSKTGGVLNRRLQSILNHINGDNAEGDIRYQDQVKDAFFEIFSQLKRKGRKRVINLLVYSLLLLWKGSRNPLLLDILSTACTYKGNNFTEIQEYMIDIFSDNNNLIQALLLDIRIEKDKLVWRFNTKNEGGKEKNKAIEISSLFKNRSLTELGEEFKSSIEFITHQFQFYTVLCKGRNQKWKSFIQRKFQQNVLFEEFLSSNYSFGKLN